MQHLVKYFKAVLLLFLGLVFSGQQASCYGAIDESDFDGDGWSDEYDCNDDDDTTYPGAPELCDGLDNDCDDVIDNGCETPAPLMHQGTERQP